MGWFYALVAKTKMPSRDKAQEGEIIKTPGHGKCVVEVFLGLKVRLSREDLALWRAISLCTLFMRTIPFILVTIFFLGMLMWEAWFYFCRPALLWHQLVSHPAKSILSTSLYIGVISLGIYFLKVRYDDRVPLQRKLNVFVIAISLLAVNLFICGGFLPIVMLNILVLFATPLIEKVQAEIKQGTRPGPTAKQLKARFWSLIASILGGIVIANLFILPVFVHDFLFTVTINALVLATTGIIIWLNRRNFFPPPSPS